MGLGRDILNDYAFEHDYPFGLASETWRTRNGRTIKISEMSENHIRNCMRLVREGDGWYTRFKQELLSREEKPWN